MAGGDDSQLQSLCHGVAPARAAAVRIRPGPAAAARRQVPRRRRHRGLPRLHASAAAASRCSRRSTPPRARPGLADAGRRAGSPSWTRCSAAGSPGARRRWSSVRRDRASRRWRRSTSSQRRRAGVGLPVRRADAHLPRSAATRSACGVSEQIAQRTASWRSQIEPGQLSPGEFSHRVRRDVERARRPHGADRQHQRLPARHPAERRAAGADARAAVVPERARRRHHPGAGAARHRRHDDDHAARRQLPGRHRA